jgi:hypothetical protein
MPSTSQSQKHWMSMAKAVKAGHVIEGLQPGTMAKLRETAQGMSQKQLNDFMVVATKPKPKRG